MTEKTGKPLFSDADNARNELAVHATVAKLQKIGETDGVGAMIAEAIGISWGIAHVFKKMGLKELHRGMRKDLARFLGE